MSTQHVYNVALLGEAEQTIDLVNDDIRVLLLTAHDDGDETTRKSRATVAAVLASAATEATATNYARQAVANLGLNQNDAANVIEWQGDDVTFAALGAGDGPGFEEFVAAVAYQHNNANDALNIPIAYIVEGFPQTCNGEAMHLRWEDGNIAVKRCSTTM